MGSIPLPALDVRAPQPSPNPIEQYGNLLALKNAMQEQQLRQQLAPLQVQNAQQTAQAGQLDLQQKQQQLKDQQAMTAAMQSWDGKDVNQLIPLVVKNGASANAVIGLKQKVLEQQKTYSDIAAADATTGSKNLETLKGKNDLVAGALQSVMQLPDEQLAQGLTSTAQDLAQKGLLDPQHAQGAAQIAQSGDPQQIRNQLSILEKGLMGQTSQIETALKTAQTGQAQAATQKDLAEVQFGTGPMADSRYRNILMNERLGRPVSADDKAWKAAYESQKTLEPRTQINLQAGLLSEQAKQMAAQNYQQTGQLPAGMRSPAMGAQILNQAASGGPVDVAQNKAQYQAALKQREAFTSGNYSQQLTAIDTAREHMKTFSALADALNNDDVQTANKIGNAFGIQFGSDKATNLRIASQAFGGEVGKAFDGAGVTQGEREQASKAFSDNMSPQQFKGAAATVDKLLAGKQTALKQTFEAGQKGQPNFGTSAPPTGLGVRLSDAMSLPQNKGKTQQQVIQDIQAHGHTVIQ